MKIATRNALIGAALLSVVGYAVASDDNISQHLASAYDVVKEESVELYNDARDWWADDVGEAEQPSDTPVENAKEAA